jgi:hypothetical protein
MGQRPGVRDTLIPYAQEPQRYDSSLRALGVATTAFPAAGFIHRTGTPFGRTTCQSPPYSFTP